MFLGETVTAELMRRISMNKQLVNNGLIINDLLFPDGLKILSWSKDDPQKKISNLRKLLWRSESRTQSN